MDILDDFFSIIDDKTGLKRVSGRPYGHLHFSPHCIIFLRVKKKSVAVAFSTDSKEKSLPAESHIKWANESGILRKEIQSGGYFKLERGAKNKSKSTLIYELPLDDEQKLLDPDFQAQAIEIIDMLKNDLDGFVTPKSNGRNIQLTDDSEASTKKADVDSGDQFGRIIGLLKVKLDSIINASREEFLDSESFKVRPGVAYDKFYLNHVTGTYDCSLQSLIHHLLWENKYYHELLPSSQLSVAEKVVRDEPECIFSLDEDDESMQPEEIDELDSDISNLFHEVCKHVGTRLQEFDFFDPSDFVEAGILDDDGDDEAEDEAEDGFDADNIDTSLAEEICKKISREVLNESALSSAISDGEIKDLSFVARLDWVSYAFDITLKIDNRNASEISEGEEDAISNILEEYFDKAGYWKELKRANLSREDCCGFIAEII
jgi:hypothetical protein